MILILRGVVKSPDLYFFLINLLFKLYTGEESGFGQWIYNFEFLILNKADESFFFLIQPTSKIKKLIISIDQIPKFIL
jgi:hypothetical protein